MQPAKTSGTPTVMFGLSAPGSEPNAATAVPPCRGSWAKSALLATRAKPAASRPKVLKIIRSAPRLEDGQGARHLVGLDHQGFIRTQAGLGKHEVRLARE